MLIYSKNVAQKKSQAPCQARGDGAGDGRLRQVFGRLKNADGILKADLKETGTAKVTGLENVNFLTAQPIGHIYSYCFSMTRQHHTEA